MKKIPVKFKKRPFTLLEVVIAMALLALLLSFLFGFYRDLNQIHDELNHTRKDNFKILYLQNRLKDVLSNTSYENQLVGKQKKIFYTEKNSHSHQQTALVLAYNNGVNVLPYFSQHVIGKLYIDKEHRLCLATWPLPKTWMAEGHPLEKSPLKREILYEGVSEFSLAFMYYPPPKKEKLLQVDPGLIKNGTEKAQPEPEQWISEWQKEYEELPSFVKISLRTLPTGENKGSSPMIFVIPLAKSQYNILYLK